MNPHFENNRQLLSGCLAGDKNASETFVRQFSNLVYQSVRHIFIIKQVSFNPQDIEDLHNTVFLRLFEDGCKKLRQYQGKNGCSLGSWIRVVTIRIVMNHFRKKGLNAIAWKKKQVSIDDLPELVVNEMTPLTEMEKAEQERLLEDGIQNLPPRDRLFMKLHFDQGLTMTEVAHAMHISVQNAYTLKHRAIQRVKSYVESAVKP